MSPPYAILPMVGLLMFLAPEHWQSASLAQPMWTADEIDSTEWNPAPGPEPIAKDRTCPLQDEGEGEGEGEGEPEAADSGRGVGSAERYLRHLVPIGASALIIAYGFSGTRRKRRHGPYTFMLAVCAILAVGNYTGFGRRPADRYVNGWEFFHYYLGSKYAPELGYTRLYSAALVADEETGRKFRHEKDAIRNLETGRCVRVDNVLSQRDRIVSWFSPQRWVEFKQDVTYFKSVLSQYQWDRIFHDKGYNATPVWGMIVGRLTNWIKTDQPAGLLGLSLLDPLLMLCAIVVVWRTFGLWTALLMVVLIGTHMAMSHTHMKGALLRTDWVMSLVLAVCAVKGNRPFAGGALAAYAATSRVFPAILAVGLLVKFLSSWVRGEPPRQAHLRFLAGFSVTLVVLLSLTLVVFGPDYWQSFTEKIWRHNDSFSPWRVGFKHLFLGAYEYRLAETGTHQEVFHERWAVWWAIQALVLVSLVYLTPRLKDWETLAFGFVPTFFLVAPTYYYYMMLVIPLLFFCGRMNRPEGTIGISWLFVSSSVAYLVHDAIGRDLQLFYALSLMIFGVCLLMGVGALLSRSRALSATRDYPDHYPSQKVGSRRPQPFGNVEGARLISTLFKRRTE